MLLRVITNNLPCFYLMLRQHCCFELCLLPAAVYIVQTHNMLRCANIVLTWKDPGCEIRHVYRTEGRASVRYVPMPKKCEAYRRYTPWLRRSYLNLRY